jgi:hypothetical protein
MPLIHLSRSGQILGQYEQDRVRAGLASGEFIGTDLAWTEGMSTWRPLSELENYLKGSAPLPAPPPAPVEAPAVVTGAGTNVPPEAGLPWENRERIGFVTAFFQTVGMILVKPTEAFAIMKKEGGLVDPLLFTLIGGSIGVLISLALQVLLNSLGLAFGGNEGVAALGAMGAVSFLLIFLVPVMVVLYAFVAAGIFHLCLMLLGGVSRPFETSLRVVCYAAGATNLLQVIPGCGGFIAALWALILYILGMSTAHQTTVGKAIGAVLLPFVLCCAGIVLIFMLVLIPAFASLSN